MPLSFRRAVLLGALTAPALAAQPAPRDSFPRPVEFTSRGLVFTGRDGFSYLALRFRLQDWAVLATDDDESGIASSTFAVRRARVRFESVVWDPRLKVNVQLSFARGDMDFENSGIPNILRDYTVSWQATPRFSVMAGQTKLPGNRQRVISSGEQQFPDRSIVNGAFTLDRDMGLWAQYNAGDENLPVILRAAITSGEGRAVQTGNAGMAYTGRLEVQPFGAFTGGGDYFEGDLAREDSPKLSVGVSWSHNEQAERTGGQLGAFLFAPRDIETGIVDVLLKYRGFSASAELARRTAPDPITTDGVDTRFVLTGSGVTAQAAYLTRANVEFGARVSVVDPHRQLGGEAERQRQVSAVVTRYFRGHRVKMQGELMRDDFRDRLSGATRGGWTLRTSLEVGI
jgi:phosphate-selective porin OprO/OprP